MDPKKSSSKNSGSRGNSAKNTNAQNFLESLKDIGTNTVNTAKTDLLKGTSEDFIKQIMGRLGARKMSGEMRPGESLEIDKAYSGEHERAVKESRQLKQLNFLKEEESQMVRRETGQLQAQMNSLQQELLQLVQTTQNLSQETQVAAMSASAEPSIYDVNHLEKLILFIKSFRKNLGSAGIWMAESNKRAQKKNFWAKYKNKKTGGSQLLLNADHYMSRSAG